MNNQDGIIKVLHPHWFYYIDLYLFSIIALAVGILFFWQFIVFSIILFFGIEIFRRAHRYYLLETGVSREYKLFSTSRKYAEYYKIQNIEVHQTFLQNILGIGTVRFDTPGSDLYEIHFDAVSNPYEVERRVRIFLSRS